jgi:hypothetical protein
MSAPHQTARIKLRLAIAAGCILVLGQSVAAQTSKCSQPTIDKLEDQSDQIRDWATLRTYFHRYNACRIDDATVTEGVSESVARILADHWATLPTAAKLFQQDPSFETFALAGVNITDSTDDIKRIDDLAAKQCPVNLHTLCRKIRRSVRYNN